MSNYCLGCGEELCCLDEDPNGDENPTCARCRAQEDHDYDAEPLALFSRGGERIADAKPAFRDVIVRGIKACDVNLDAFSSSEDLSEWAKEFWKVLSETFTKDDLHVASNFGEVFGEEFFEKFLGRMNDLQNVEKPIIVAGVSHQAVKAFDVLYSGWECDGKGWIVKTDAGNKLVLSNHGSNYFAKPKELQDHIDNYRKTISESEAALKLLGA